MTWIATAIGKHIQDARKTAGWTQTDLSVLLRRRGVRWSPAIVSLVENGDRRLQFTEAVILVRLLDPFGLTLEGLAAAVPVVLGEDVRDVNGPMYEEGDR